MARYTAQSPLLSPTPNPAGLVAAYLHATAQSPHSETDRREQAEAYVAACAPVGLDTAIVLAQICHETAALTSWWSQAPRHNPAGIGVTGATARLPQLNYVYHPQTGRYRRGYVYDSLTAAVTPHLSRLLAYACAPGDLAGHPARAALIAQAPTFPSACKGTAQTLAALGRVHNPCRSCGWAWPGDGYGEALARWANQLTEGLV